MAESVEASVRSDVEALVTAHPMGESLAQLAFNLARHLDRGDLNHMARAGIARELRETLCELARLAEADDDGIAAALSVPTSLRDGA